MIYLLEDDDNIRSFVSYALNSSGFEVKGFGAPSEFWRAMETQQPDLLLLDIMLPEEDGISVLKKLREKTETAKLPIIMLTAKATEYDKVVGLDSGADDYIAKPFGTMELISRIKALLRRTKLKEIPAAERDEYSFGELYVCPSKHIIRAGGTDVMLTLKEYELLLLLMKSRGRVFNRDELLTEIWGYSFDGESRTVDVHIRTLRQKLLTCGKYIETIRGIGYRFGGESKP